MEKQVKIFVIVAAGIAGYILYKNYKKKSVVTEIPIKNITGDEIHNPPLPSRHDLKELDTEHTTQEEIATTNIHIDPVLPDFGKPELLEEHFKNYVDVKKNEYFKPQISTFFK